MREAIWSSPPGSQSNVRAAYTCTPAFGGARQRRVDVDDGRLWR